MRRLYLVLLASLIVSVNGRAEPALPPNGIAAIVNGAIITYQQVAELALMIIETYPRPSMMSAAALAEYEKRCEQAYKESLESLIEKQLVLDDFKNAGGQMPESLLEDEIKSGIRKRYGDRVTLVKTLQAKGLRYENYRQQEHDRIILEVMRHKNVFQPVLISPQKIERYYQTNLANFQVDDQVKLRVIVLNCPVSSMSDDVKAMAREIMLKLDEGVGFAEMAGIYSEGSQRTEGGDWGWKDRAFLKKGLSDTAFALKVGQHSGVLGEAVEEDQSYWVFQYNEAGQLARGRKYSAKDALLEEKTFAPNQAPPATANKFYLMLVEDQRKAHTKPMEEVRDEIEKTLLVQERSRLQKKWVDRLRSKAFVRYF